MLMINYLAAPRIRAIHVGLNNISSIAPNLANSVPHLETLGEKLIPCLGYPFYSGRESD